MNILSEIRNRFRPVLADCADDPAQYLAMIRPSQDPIFGDFQANFAMPLAKRAGGNPRELATELAGKVDVADICDEPEVAGPGFINLRLRDDWLQQQATSLISDIRLGVPETTEPRTVVVDFSAPNVAKPMHVGHLRSTVIGAAIVSVLRFLGHKVVGDNHIGDWGTQFGMIIYGYKNFRDDTAFQKDPVPELARLYRLVNQLSDYHAAKNELPELEEQLAARQQELEAAEAATDASDKKARKALNRHRSAVDELRGRIAAQQDRIAAVEGNADLAALAQAHPGIAEKARQETARLHAGDEENNALWNDFLPKCLGAIQGVYDRLQIEFDETLGESYYQPMLADVVADLEAKGIAKESEGAVCVFNEGFPFPFIVRKTDGAFTYATTDLATIRYRVEHFNADEILYVVDSRQGDHFEQLFATVRQWGFDNVELRHVKFGTIVDKKTRKPYKTRSGDTVGLESLLDEAHARARKIVDENDDRKDEPELDDDAREAVAEAVGIGGIRYFDLNHNRDSDYAFDWDAMLDTKGDTATYMQYAYARVFGIFRRGGIDRNALLASGSAIQISHAAERALALQLCRFADALDDVLNDYRPNQLTQYLFGLANCFAVFFDQCPVLKAEDEATRNSRLLLCDLTARVIDKGLSLLGIETCERM